MTLEFLKNVFSLLVGFSLKLYAVKNVQYRETERLDTNWKLLLAIWQKMLISYV